MKRPELIVTILIVLTCVVLAGLVGVAVIFLRPEPTPPTPDAVHTEVAQTIQAQLTMDALLTLMPPITQVVPSPTLPVLTPFPPTPTLTYTLPPPTPTQVLPTPLPPTATSVPVRCDAAAFVRDVTVPDGTSFPPGGEFTKIWRLQNVGSCTWDRNYSLIFAGGDQLGTTRRVALNTTVSPGQVVDVAVDMFAPNPPGRYKSFWMLESSAGKAFGIGRDSDDPFWADIRVVPANSSYEFDLAVDVCQATWRSGAGSLPCPGNTGSTAGSVTLTYSPSFENGAQENEATLWTRPEVKVGGWIQGVYPPYSVKAGDQFVAQIGCLKDSQGCEVTFTLDYILSNGQIRNLGQWYEVYDGRINTIQVDLTSLAGNSVQFVLSVTAVNNPNKANAFWFVPSVRRAVPTPTRPANTPTATATRPANTPTATATQPVPSITPTATLYPPDEPTPTSTLSGYP